MTQAPQRAARPTTLEWFGRRAWHWVGISLAVIIAYLGLSLISGLVMPLIVAAVIGALFAPVCLWLSKWMPRHLAALIVLLVLLTIGVGTVVIAVRGVIDQAGEIARQVATGLDSLQVWAVELGVEEISLDDAQSTIQDWGQDLASGVASGLGTVFSGTATVALGLFVGLFLLYFILADWNLLVNFTGRNIGLPNDVGAAVVNDATFAMRRYFLALTASNIVSSTIVGVSVWALGLPLAFPIAVVTMVTSYIPFLGAIFSGAFAVLVALGSGGIGDAVIMLLIVLVAQNGVQTIIQTFITQGALKLHPILILGTTIAGGALFGILGAALSTPVFASGLKIIERLRHYSRAQAGLPPTGADPGPDPPADDGPDDDGPADGGLDTGGLDTDGADDGRTERPDDGSEPLSGRGATEPAQR